jgi:TolB-like protein
MAVAPMPEAFVRNIEQFVTREGVDPMHVVRSAIGDNGEEQRLIKTLPRKGFRFVGAVREEDGPAASVELRRPGLKLPVKPSIAVLPFANLSADQKQGYLADGIVEDIITELSRCLELFVVACNFSFQYKGKGADVRQVGRELGVRYLLEGSVRPGGDSIDANYAHARTLLATSYTAAWGNTLDGDFLAPSVLDRALDLARKAVQLDQNLPGLTPVSDMS